MTKYFANRLDLSEVEDVLEVAIFPEDDGFSRLVKLTAYDGSTDRLKRLGDVREFIYLHASYRDVLALARLHDHKGILTTYWRRRPEERTLLLCHLAWERIGHEPGDHVFHFVLKNPDAV